MNYSESQNLLTTSYRCYLLMLYVCQPDFRRRYGQDMAQVFRDRSREIRQQNGLAALLCWWGEALLDLTGTAVTSHFVALEQGGWNMKRMLRIAAQITFAIGGMILFVWPLIKRPMPYWNAGIYLCCAIALLSAALGLTWATMYRAPQTNTDKKEVICLKL